VRLPLLACEGVAAVVALGTGWLAVRIDPLATNVKTLEPAAERGLRQMARCAMKRSVLRL
jgi:hypothetical protein